MICDRFLLANVVYQGYAGGLDVAALWQVGEIAVGGLHPDLTIVLDMDVAQARRRIGRELDRMESRGLEFLERVRRGFLRESCLGHETIEVVDAARAPDAVQADIQGGDRSPVAFGGAMMSAPAILGHERVLEAFRRSLRQGRLASTFLFTGPPGIGKRTTALYLAQSLLCETAPPDSLAACGACPSCVQVAAETHPDLILVRKPEDKSFIPIELFIGDREHRMREGLCHDIGLKPFRGGRKVAIIDDADYLNQEGANCLLKTLEEPPPRSVILLIGSSEQRQLPTIRSRCQMIRFAPLSDAQVARLLREKRLIEDDADADQIARWGEGSLRQALEWADTELQEARRRLMEQLGQADFDSVSLARQVEEFVDSAGKDVPARRARLRQVIQSAAGFYRGLMRHLLHIDSGGDPIALQCIQQADPRWQGEAVRASRCLTRSLEALSQVDANANLPTLISGWIDDLGQLRVPHARKG